eukprot:6447261-Pyramimonas_sp.AAC.1
MGHGVVLRCASAAAALAGRRESRMPARALASSAQPSPLAPGFAKGMGQWRSRRRPPKASSQDADREWTCPGWRHGKY